MAKKGTRKSFKRGGRVGKINGHVTHLAYRKRKAESYLSRATCIACRKVFRSPIKRRIHVESGHKIEIGWNRNRTVKSTGVLG